MSLLQLFSNCRRCVALRRLVSTQFVQKRSLKEVRNSRACETHVHHFTLARNPRKHCVSNTDAPVAQLDRAPPSEGGGHTFESCRVRHFGIRYWRRVPPFFCPDQALTPPIFVRALAAARSVLPPVCPTPGAAAKPSSS